MSEVATNRVKEQAAVMLAFAEGWSVTEARDFPQ